MKNITVRKDALLEQLRANRAAHRAEYDRAVEIYKLRFVEEATRFAEEAVRCAAAGIWFKDFVWLPVPEEHTDDYDRVISLMEWEIADEVELSESDFRCYVLNEWGWMSSFASNTRSYTGG
jgi:hypothetical protein